MIVDGQKYLNESGEGSNSHFTIPVPDLTTDLPIIADTLAMGTPHEIKYTLTFDPSSIDSKSSLPQEGAKRVLITDVSDFRLEIARKCGITVPDFKLMDGKYFATKRFDIENG